MAKSKLPLEILIYQCDTLDDGTPVWGAATSPQEIGECDEGVKVGVYTLNMTKRFTIDKYLEVL